MESPNEVTRVELQEWKAHKVTEQYFAAMREQSALNRDQLARTAGLDSLRDSFLRGYEQAISDFLNVQVEEPHGEDTTDAPDLA